MIISCNQCNKKFEIDPNLIPDAGRLLQCGSCKHKWFYKKKINVDESLPLEDSLDEKIEIKINDQKLDENKKENLSTNNYNEKNNVDDIGNLEEEYAKKKEIIVSDKLNILNIFFIIIISIIALIILIDTFKSPISLIVPDIDFFLESLYETLKDVFLFFNDLIK
jgi:predicted Zn finger-like uncharacterized protein